MSDGYDIDVKIVPKAKRVMNALRRLVDNFESIAEDFAYRDDVKDGKKCLRYILNNLTWEVEKVEAKG